MQYVKVIQSGDLVEVYRYEKEPHPRKKKFKTKRRSQEYSPRRARRSYLRSVFSFTRLVRSTLFRGNPAFFTLTFRDSVDIKQGYKAFTRFGVMLRRRFGKEVAWVGVPEFGQRASKRLHFHALIWGLPYETLYRERTTRYLAGLWGRGFLDCIETDGHPKLASYFAKYMSKTMSDSRLFGQKAYTASRNCVRPLSFSSNRVFDPDTIPWWVANVDKLVAPFREKNYDTEWLGRANYQAYSLSDIKNAGNLDKQTSDNI